MQGSLFILSGNKVETPKRNSCALRNLSQNFESRCESLLHQSQEAERRGVKKFSFDVEGEPKGKARPRFARIENTVRTYTPKTTQEYEKKIAQAFIAAGGTIFDYPYLKVKIAAYFPIPKSVRKSDRLEMEAGGRWHNKKPDCDNVAKAVLDALNNVAWVDDKQIVELSILKVYSKYPRITVTIVETV